MKKLSGFSLLASVVTLSLLVPEMAVSQVMKGPKRHYDVPMERAIHRRQMVINQTTIDLKPTFDGDDVDMSRARSVRLNQKTQELISQLESLYQRKGQQSRRGEIAMRLAELYYERGQSVAEIEASAWEEAIKEWESQSDSERAKTPRPVLKTPKADTFRRKALALYRNLEQSSRGPDKGRSLMIRRDEVLFFLGGTLKDLGQSSSAVNYLEELVQVYSRSPRVPAARLDLGDIYFDSNRFEKAIPHYLQLAVLKIESNQDNLRAYSLYKLGWCYMNTNQSPKAVLAFQRALESSKNSKNERRVAFENEALTDLGRAFALAGQYEEGDAYFSKMGPKGQEYLLNFRLNAANNARDEGKLTIAAQFYTKLIAMDPKGPKALEFAMARADLYKKSNQAGVYAKELERLLEQYGAGSSYMASYQGDSATKQAISADLVGLVRREAKAIHNAAQKRKDDKAYIPALPYYKIYFKHVPKPNPDTAENVHEMRFFYAELLYKLEDYSEAAEVYATVGEGKYGAPASYNRILALRAATKQDPNKSKDLLAASEAFIRQFPQDSRSGDILYSSAQDAYKAGQAEQSISTLDGIVNKFSSNPRGVEAADRVLFILEEKKNYGLGEKRAEEYLSNKELTKAGGEDFVKRTTEYRDRAAFKRVEVLADKTPKDNESKANQYLELAEKMEGDLKEKALNNAMVHADKSENEELAQETRLALMKAFPKSDFAKNVYLRQAEASAKAGDWTEALKFYNTFLKQYPKPGKEHASALWNVIYIQSHLEDVYEPRFRPRHRISQDLIGHLRNYLKLYPRGENIVQVVGVLVLREGVTLGELPSYDTIRGVRSVVFEAETVIKARSGNTRTFEALTQEKGPKAATTVILKEALGTAAYQALEPKYVRYQNMSLNYQPAAFAGSLQRKMKALEDLEKEYIRAASYGYPETTLKTYERLSRMYMALAQAIEKAPASPEELKPFTEPLKKKSLGFVNSCLEKTAEYKIASDGALSCRVASLDLDPERVGLTAEIIPEPTWLMSSLPSSTKPILVKAVAAQREKKFGEVSLALSLAEKQNLKGEDKNIADLLKGLQAWTLNQGQEASKLFLSVSDFTKDSGIREAAEKNLAALNLQIGSYRQAVTLTSKFSSSSDGAHLKALSLKAVGQYQEAIKAYDQAIRDNSGDPRLYLNKALAAAQAKDKAMAVESLQNYIDRANPPTGHISRTLLRQWRGAAGS